MQSGTLSFPNGKCCPVGQRHSNSWKFDSKFLPNWATFSIWATKIEQNSYDTFLCFSVVKQKENMIKFEITVPFFALIQCYILFRIWETVSQSGNTRVSAVNSWMVVFGGQSVYETRFTKSFNRKANLHFIFIFSISYLIFSHILSF